MAKLKITVQVGKYKKSISVDRTDRQHVRQLTGLLAKQVSNEYTTKKEKTPKIS